MFLVLSDIVRALSERSWVVLELGQGPVPHGRFIPLPLVLSCIFLPSLFFRNPHNELLGAREEGCEDHLVCTQGSGFLLTRQVREVQWQIRESVTDVFDLGHAVNIPASPGCST